MMNDPTLLCLIGPTQPRLILLTVLQAVLQAALFNRLRLPR